VQQAKKLLCDSFNNAKTAEVLILWLLQTL